MRAVQPKVIGPIARPSLDWSLIRQYLGIIKGDQWLEQRPPQGSTGQDLIEFAGRLCYRSWVPGLNPNISRIRKDQEEYLLNILRSGHGSVLEHANYSFIFHNVSRVLTHELVRHRAGVAFSQESLRFVRLTDIPFWFPDWALDDEQLMSKAVDLLHSMEDFQRWMADHFDLDKKDFSVKKKFTSFMRRFAPEGVATGILATLNIRALRHIIYMRTSLGAEEEIRLIFDKVAQIMLVECPGVMQDYSPNQDQEWIPDFLKV